MMVSGADYIGLPGTQFMNFVLTCGRSDIPPAITYQPPFTYKFPILKKARRTLLKLVTSDIYMDKKQQLNPFDDSKKIKLWEEDEEDRQEAEQERLKAERDAALKAAQQQQPPPKKSFPGATTPGSDRLPAGTLVTRTKSRAQFPCDLFEYRQDAGRSQACPCRYINKRYLQSPSEYPLPGNPFSVPPAPHCARLSPFFNKPEDCVKTISVSIARDLTFARVYGFSPLL
jgi:hypothetical protein